MLSAAAIKAEGKLAGSVLFLGDGHTNGKWYNEHTTSELVAGRLPNAARKVLKRV